MYFRVCGKIFPDLPVFHVLKLCAADCVEPVYGDWKTEKGYFPVPDAPDSLFTAADCDSAAVIGIDGIMYAGPIADFVAGVVALAMAGVEVRRLRRMESASVHA